MSFKSSNNSRNVASLLRHEVLEPILPKRLPTVSSSQTQITAPIKLDITESTSIVEELPNSMTLRRRTPMSSSNSQADAPIRPSFREQEPSVEAMRVRLEQMSRFYQERQNNWETKFMVRLNELEHLVMKEVPRIDSASLLSGDIVGFKQAIRDIRRQQQYQAHELAVLKATQSERSSSDQAATATVKDREKMTVLFMEMVRLGETVDRIATGMNSAGRGYETKVADMESRLDSYERNMAQLANKSTSGNELISDFGDRIINRVQSAETNLLVLGKEQVKDKETMSKLLAQNERMGEDMQALLRSMQADFQNKLQSRISQAIGRLIFEHEERVKAQEEIRKNLDLRQRLNNEKLLSQKIENKNRYDSMDAQVRNQFLRKEESIRSLQDSIENEFKHISRMMEEEAVRRKDLEGNLRIELKGVQDSLRREYDVNRNQQGELVEKITDMIKEEIRVRLSSELDLKKLTSDIANELVTDLNVTKENLAVTARKLTQSIRELSAESAERAAKLSHYVDAQVKKVVETVTEKYGKMKSIFTKLAEQLRNHLLHTESNRSNVEQRLNTLESSFEKMKTQVNNEIDEFYADLEARLKEEKDFIQANVYKRTNELMIRVNKLDEYTSQYYQLLKNGIENTKESISSKLSSISKPAGKDPQQEKEMRQLREIIFKIRSITESIHDEQVEQNDKVSRQLHQVDTRLKELVLQTETALSSKLNKNAEKAAQLEEAYDQLSLKVNSLRADGSAGGASSDRLKRLGDQIEQLETKLKDTEQGALGGVARNEESIVRLKSDITVLKSEISAIDDDVRKILSQQNAN